MKSADKQSMFAVMQPSAFSLPYSIRNRLKIGKAVRLKGEDKDSLISKGKRKKRSDPKATSQCLLQATRSPINLPVLPAVVEEKHPSFSTNLDLLLSTILMVWNISFISLS